jgi:hypothetical protein
VTSKRFPFLRKTATTTPTKHALFFPRGHISSRALPCKWRQNDPSKRRDLLVYIPEGFNLQSHSCLFSHKKHKTERTKSMWHLKCFNAIRLGYRCRSKWFSALNNNLTFLPAHYTLLCDPTISLPCKKYHLLGPNLSQFHPVGTMTVGFRRGRTEFFRLLGYNTK